MGHKVHLIIFAHYVQLCDSCIDIFEICNLQLVIVHNLYLLILTQPNFNIIKLTSTVFISD